MGTRVVGWLAYLVIASGVGCLLVYIAMMFGWEGPASSSAEFAHHNEWLGMGCPMVLTGLVMVFIAAGQRSERLVRHRIRTHGIEGRARVIELVPRELPSKFTPQFDLRIEISLEGRSPYSAVRRVALLSHVAKRLVPDSTWRVRVDPEDPQSFLIDGVDSEFHE